LHCQEIGSCQHRNGSGNQVNTEIDVSKIKYENRENIKSILNELLKLSQLLNEWISNNTKLYQEITKK
jgi:predicted aspartyl protease